MRGVEEESPSTYPAEYFFHVLRYCHSKSIELRAIQVGCRGLPLVYTGIIILDPRGRLVVLPGLIPIYPRWIG